MWSGARGLMLPSRGELESKYVVIQAVWIFPLSNWLKPCSWQSFRGTKFIHRAETLLNSMVRQHQVSGCSKYLLARRDLGGRSTRLCQLGGGIPLQIHKKKFTAMAIFNKVTTLIVAVKNQFSWGLVPPASAAESRCSGVNRFDVLGSMLYTIFCNPPSFISLVPRYAQSYHSPIIFFSPHLPWSHQFSSTHPEGLGTGSRHLVGCK